MSNLTSLTILSQISAYESIAQSHFQEAAKWQPCIHAVAKYLLENERGRQNQEKADALRAVLKARKERLERHQRFVVKLIEAQRLAHVALERRTA